MSYKLCPDGKIEVPFGEYFEICEPHYTRFDQLDRQNCYYLSNVYDKLDAIINNPSIDHIPIEVIESILVVELQKYDTMIDVDGNVVDWSNKEQYYTLDGRAPAEWYGLTPCELCNDIPSGFGFECRLSAINNVLFEDKLDIEASLIYNLIEIRPKTTEITIDYLKYFLWFIDKKNCNKDGWNFRYQIYDVFSELLEKHTGNSRFLFTCENLKNAYAIMDPIEEHPSIIKAHQERLDQQSRQYGTLYLKAAFGSPYYDNLKSLEKRVTHILAKSHDEERKEISSFTGFISELERFEISLNSLKATGAQHVSFLPYRAVEVVLRAKLRCCLGTQVRAGDMMGQLIDYIRDYWSDITYQKYDYEDKIDLISSIRNIANRRNEWAHGTCVYTLEEATQITQQIYDTIKKIDKYL